MSHGPVKFRSAAAKPYFHDTKEDGTVPADNGNSTLVRVNEDAFIQAPLKQISDISFLTARQRGKIKMPGKILRGCKKGAVQAMAQHWRAVSGS
ncbi:hypothetical protein UVI_02036010 [Ustilaginoidea virens]|uniref:Uncharacterized protein n=1 Tax=Ustilaginoidea virens TaxID=1159556 RepID=A0A1B5KSZ4_USTVR|nr:hypothetical protein UVI_02036010 [Ustilaginoidea virens]